MSVDHKHFVLQGAAASIQDEPDHSTTSAFRQCATANIRHKHKHTRTESATPFCSQVCIAIEEFDALPPPAVVLPKQQHDLVKAKKDKGGKKKEKGGKNKGKGGKKKPRRKNKAKSKALTKGKATPKEKSKQGPTKGQECKKHPKAAKRKGHLSIGDQGAAKEGTRFQPGDFRQKRVAFIREFKAKNENQELAGRELQKAASLAWVGSSTRAQLLEGMSTSELQRRRFL